jgi:hypothetical protein
MLDLSQTRIVNSMSVPLYSITTSFEDGTGLIGKQVNGVMSATVNATATANDLFLGIALSTLSTPANAVNVVAITVPAAAPYTVVLPQTPNAGQISIAYATGAGFTSEGTTAGVTAAAEFNLTGATVTFDAADAGLAVVATYNYALSVVQAQSLVGQGLIGGLSPSNITGEIGVIKKGLVFTSLFDASVNWGSVTQVVCGNNGMFTSAANVGAAVKGYVAYSPSIYSPFLGIYFDA